ncbi:MAG: hypothetical protein NZ551_04010 [Microscillaceae bacterium]|nr:hypothetical protein [Microscillaceae bacterium]MDW8460355.1 hypothetical protein [Cytophagales bacterium]
MKPQKPFYVIVHVPFLQFAAVALFPFILIKEKNFATNRYLINHELIHFRQQIELLILPFYLLYGLFFLYNWLVYWDSQRAYYEICFEREAYQNEDNLNYLQTRPLWAWIKYLRKQP